MLTDERILAPGLTIVEEEGSLTAADLGGNSVPSESKYFQQVSFSIISGFISSLFNSNFYFRCSHVQSNASWFVWRNDRVATNCHWKFYLWNSSTSSYQPSEL